MDPNLISFGFLDSSSSLYGGIDFVELRGSPQILVNIRIFSDWTVFDYYSLGYCITNLSSRVTWNVHFSGSARGDMVN